MAGVFYMRHSCGRSYRSVSGDTSTPAHQEIAYTEWCVLFLFELNGVDSNGEKIARNLSVGLKRPVDVLSEKGAQAPNPPLPTNKKDTIIGVFFVV